MGPVVLIGASRGLGLGFLQQLCADGVEVIATVRRQEDLDRLASLDLTPAPTLHLLDVADAQSREGFLEAMRSRTFDTLIHNAGIYGPRSLQPGDLAEETWMEVLQVDTIAPLLIAQGLLPQLRAAQAEGRRASLHFLTSRMGSIVDNGSGGCYFYRSAKAGLNAAVRSLSIDLHPEGIPVQLLHPGWVQTAMGGDHAPLSVVESVVGMLQRIGELDLDHSGRFVDWSGEEIPF